MLQRPSQMLLTSQSLATKLSASGSVLSFTVPTRGIKNHAEKIATTTKAIGIPIEHEIHNIIKWRKPERLPFWDPRKSCDLKPLPPIDPDWLKVEYEPFGELINQLPEEHRKRFTVDYYPRKEGIKVIYEQTFKRVRRHNYDGKVEGERSFEHIIAWATVKIRDLRYQMETNPVCKKNGKFKQQAKELVDKRKKYLNQLRHVDYKRFEWLIEVLGIMFKPNGQFEVVRRRLSINKLTKLMCDEIIDSKMKAYKEELESEKVPFLEEKLAILKEIQSDEEAMNLQSSVADQITATIKQIENLKRTHLELHPVNVEEVEENNVVLS